jgi:predicted metal-binding protein
MLGSIPMAFCSYAGVTTFREIYVMNYKIMTDSMREIYENQVQYQKDYIKHLLDNNIGYNPNTFEYTKDIIQNYLDMCTKINKDDLMRKNI